MEAANAFSKGDDFNHENYDVDGPIINIELITENLFAESSYFKVKVDPNKLNKNTPPLGYEVWIDQHYRDQLRWANNNGAVGAFDN